ncbi:YczE/YyaS/YitT family protein [Specibacter cremeus]|uniref:membrane protein YczE n=1 Tax=Specibacter cremeus TaxID=1629051 RepID=UPI003B83951F
MLRFLTTDLLAARLVRLFVGLAAYGLAIALMIQGGVGASPWDVFGQGAARTTGLSFGVATIMISVGVLLLWIPLRQWPGFGTVANTFLVGAFADVGLAIVPRFDQLALQCVSFAAGLVLLAFATALYIGAGLGPGPRDGLMTGLVRVTGRPVWLIRTGIELIVVVAGFFLGGTVGLGTLVFAIGVGPLTQVMLRWLRVNLHAGKPGATAPEPATAVVPALPGPGVLGSGVLGPGVDGIR